MKTTEHFLDLLKNHPRLDENTYMIGNDKGCAWVELITKDDTTIVLEKIWVPSKLRREGAGSNVMMMITEAADVMGFDIELTAAEIKQTGFVLNGTHRIMGGATDKTNRINPRKLAKWYNKFGFDFVKKNEDGKWEMKYFSKKLEKDLAV